MKHWRAFLKFVCPTAVGTVQFVTGLSVGTLLLVALSTMKTAFGGDATVEVAVAVGVSLVVWRGLRAARFSSVTMSNAGLILTVVSGLVGPRLFGVVSDLFALVTLETLTSPTLSSSIMLLATMSWLSPLCLGGLAMVLEHESDSSPRQVLIPALGVAVSWLVLPLTLALWMDFTVLTWLACACCMISAGYRLLIMQRQESEAVESDPAPVLDSQLHWSQLGVIALLSGASLPLLSFISRQIMPHSLTSEFALMTGLLGGFVWGATKRRTLLGLPAGSALPLILAVCVSLMVSGYPLWTDLSLWMNAWISQAWLLFTLRDLVLICATMPVGWVLGQGLRLASTESDLFASRKLLLLVCGCVAGLAMSSWSHWTPASLAMLVLAGGIGLAAISWMSARCVLPTGRLSRLGWGTLSLVALVGPLLMGNFAPKRSEKILFSTNAFLSFRNGIQRDWLPWLDDGRLMAEFGGLQNRWSVWKHRGAQVLVRKNGIYSELRSLDPDVCPQSPAEVLPSVMPLVLHRAAEHVLILGLHTATLETCSAYPLRSVTTVENDPAAYDMLGWLTEQEMAPYIVGDARYRFVKASPVQAMSVRHPLKYDVIISPQAQVSTVTDSVEVTAAYYRKVLDKLSEEGLFCQRLAYFDLGPEPVRQIAATMAQVFPNILITESAPGELLFIGGRNSQSWIDTGVVDRLKTPQCRYVLAQIGWDWSTVLSRGGLDDEAVKSFCEQSPSRSLNGTMSFTLPVEVARWGVKSEATRTALAQHGKSLGSFLGDAAEAREVSDRLTDLRLAHQVLSEHPDQPWAYRAVLKKQLQDRPRSKIIQVKGEGLKRGLHPEDQRRKSYLIALSKASTQERPPLDAVAAVAEFDAPFDPLLTFFVHHEAARLLGKAADDAPEARLRHGLHTVYFAPGQDSSVRNVCEAVSLLCETPEACPDEVQRWDHLNGLMEIMRQRWQVRSQRSKGPSKYETIDTERSVAAVEEALAVMDALHKQVGLTERDWETRKDVLEETLLRPLKRHQSEQFRQLPLAPRQTGAKSSAG